MKMRRGREPCGTRRYIMSQINRLNVVVALRKSCVILNYMQNVLPYQANIEKLKQPQIIISVASDESLVINSDRNFQSAYV